MTCEICGGDMTGDGYTSVLCCERVEFDPEKITYEADAGPIFCTMDKESNDD